jgi:hypothetical protein
MIRIYEGRRWVELIETSHPAESAPRGLELDRHIAKNRRRFALRLGRNPQWTPWTGYLGIQNAI